MYVCIQLYVQVRPRFRTWGGRSQPANRLIRVSKRRLGEKEKRGAALNELLEGSGELFCSRPRLVWGRDEGGRGGCGCGIESRIMKCGIVRWREDLI